jgi:hypothetical protein
VQSYLVVSGVFYVVAGLLALLGSVAMQGRGWSRPRIRWLCMSRSYISHLSTGCPNRECQDCGGCGAHFGVHERLKVAFPPLPTVGMVRMSSMTERPVRGGKLKTTSAPKRIPDPESAFAISEPTS